MFAIEKVVAWSETQSSETHFEIREEKETCKQSIVNSFSFEWKHKYYLFIATWGLVHPNNEPMKEANTDPRTPSPSQIQISESIDPAVGFTGLNAIFAINPMERPNKTFIK